jgi:OFA family oxalate/formate antiporter-like MFS transporter
MRGVVVTVAGIAVNLCLGILYAWSIWKAKLLAPKDVEPGTAMPGINAGWEYLSDAQATWAYAICGFTFALVMIPGGRLQDRFGPRWGATFAGLCLGAGCLLAGWMQSFEGLILGFGLLGGAGMGLGYAAATPAAVKWFPAQKRGLIVGLVVGGFGGAAIYISPLMKWLITEQGISGSFTTLGIFFASVIIIAAQFLKAPPPGFVPASATPTSPTTSPSPTRGHDFPLRDALRTYQIFALVILFLGSAQAGILVIANASPILNSTASNIPVIAANAWILAAFGGIVNAAGRAGTGYFSDRVGRQNAFRWNAWLAVGALIGLPFIIAAGNVALLFLAVGVVYWQYGGTLALMPAWTADFFGPKNLGANYGIVFLGWGLAFFVALGAGFARDLLQSFDVAFYVSAGLLLLSAEAGRFLPRPRHPSEDSL